MAKVSKLSQSSVLVSFHCEGDTEDCDKSAKLSVAEVIRCGVPYCNGCDRDMIASHDFVEVEA